MQRSPTSSFFRFVIGFLVFICVFFGVTLLVTQVSASQQGPGQTAAAEAVMLQQANNK